MTVKGLKAENRHFPFAAWDPKGAGGYYPSLGLVLFSLTRSPKHEEPIGFLLNVFKGGTIPTRSPIPPEPCSLVPLP